MLRWNWVGGSIQSRLYLILPGVAGLWVLDACAAQGPGGIPGYEWIRVVSILVWLPSLFGIAYLPQILPSRVHHNKANRARIGYVLGEEVADVASESWYTRDTTFGGHGAEYLYFKFSRSQLATTTCQALQVDNRGDFLVDYNRTEDCLLAYFAGH